MFLFKLDDPFIFKTFKPSKTPPHIRTTVTCTCGSKNVFQASNGCFSKFPWQQAWDSCEPFWIGTGLRCCALLDQACLYQNGFGQITGHGCQQEQNIIHRMFPNIESNRTLTPPAGKGGAYLARTSLSDRTQVDPMVEKKRWRARWEHWIWVAISEY